MLVTTFIALLLFYLSFLHIFYYAYSKAKKNTQCLNLGRAKGILLSPREKKLYESLSLYLSVNLRSDNKIAVIGYYPQLSFLSERENIFSRDDYIFTKLDSLLGKAYKFKRPIWVARLLEEKIISLMKTYKPKVVLTVKADYLPDFEVISPKIKNYLEVNYALDQQFGPAPILGRENENQLARIYSYKSKGR